LFQRNDASFRDPGGFVFSRDGKIYRRVFDTYNYGLLMNSGLYKTLVDKGWLVEHTEMSKNTLSPISIPFITYPYEWCFGQIKDAALLTLDICLEAIQYGLILKDASAYNIQFMNNRPVFIDTLSFVEYVDGCPWEAYKQFCQHFIAPLALAKYCDPRLILLLREFMDGIPIDLASSMLPMRAYLNLGIAIHIKLHSIGQNRVTTRPAVKIGKAQLVAFLRSLRSVVSKMKYRVRSSSVDYHEFSNYSDQSSLNKRIIVDKFLRCARSEKIFDIGCNTGEFSVEASSQGYHVISADYDHDCIELLYRTKRKRIYPMVLDASSPSPSVGWMCMERSSIFHRLNVDTVMALALIHHLSIKNNVPFEESSRLFALLLGKTVEGALLIEFVLPEDPSVVMLTRDRSDLYEWYNQEKFEEIFSRRFTIIDREPIIDSPRVVYLMRLV